MKKASNGTARAGYDFSKGVRGKYAARYVRGTNLVRLDEDVKRAFPTDRAVNRALRSLCNGNRIPAKTR